MILRSSYVRFVAKFVNVRNVSSSKSNPKSSPLLEFSTAYAEEGLEILLHKLPGTDSNATRPYELGLTQIKARDLDCANAPTILLLHGMISNSRMFFSKKVQGLGPYLASN